VEGFDQQVLRTDSAGMPLEWVGYQEAVKLHHLGQIIYSCGSAIFTVHGGRNAVTGRRSVVEVNSIIATQTNISAFQKARKNYNPPLSNHALFKRDNSLCLYCGSHFYYADLSCDHVKPLSQNGRNSWNNVVTACKRCNNHKAGRTPEQAGMELLAIPFVPTRAEYVYLQSKRVLADQMEFLRCHFPRTSPLHLRESH